MYSSAQSGSVHVPPSDPAPLKPRRRDEVTYQAVTVAAILLLLGSLWVF